MTMAVSLTHPRRGPLRVGQHATGPGGTAGHITDIRHGAHDPWVSDTARCPLCYVTVTWNRGTSDTGQAVHRARDLTRVGGITIPGDVVAVAAARGPHIVTAIRLYANTVDGPGPHRELQVSGPEGERWIPDGDAIPLPGVTADDARRWHNP